MKFRCNIRIEYGDEEGDPSLTVVATGADGVQVSLNEPCGELEPSDLEGFAHELDASGLVSQAVTELLLQLV